MKKAALAIIKNENGETLFLLRKHKPFGWGLVGGKLEDGETAKEACVREIQEESGISIEPSQLRLVGDDISINGNPVTIFEVLLDHTPDVTIDKKEHLNSMWITAHDNNKLAEPMLKFVFSGRTLDFIAKEIKIKK